MLSTLRSWADITDKVAEVAEVTEVANDANDEWETVSSKNTKNKFPLLEVPEMPIPTDESKFVQFRNELVRMIYPDGEKPKIINLDEPEQVKAGLQRLFSLIGYHSVDEIINKVRTGTFLGMDIAPSFKTKDESELHYTDEELLFRAWCLILMYYCPATQVGEKKYEAFYYYKTTNAEENRSSLVKKDVDKVNFYFTNIKGNNGLEETINKTIKYVNGILNWTNQPWKNGDIVSYDFSPVAFLYWAFKLVFNQNPNFSDAMMHYTTHLFGFDIKIVSVKRDDTIIHFQCNTFGEKGMSSFPKNSNCKGVAFVNPESEKKNVYAKGFQKKPATNIRKVEQKVEKKAPIGRPHDLHVVPPGQFLPWQQLFQQFSQQPSNPFGDDAVKMVGKSVVSEIEDPDIAELEKQIQEAQQKLAKQKILRQKMEELKKVQEELKQLEEMNSS